MAAAGVFQYEEAFTSNLGLLTPEEQSRLRQASVAIAGMGGVGGAHLLTLARLGIGRFTIADGDTFELRNFNRQLGATLTTLGRSKTEVMADLARAINAELAIRILPAELSSSNIDEFLAGCDVVVDGLDFFSIDARRLLFRRAKERGLYVVTCGPLGFGASLLIFAPDGPSFDDFMAIRDGMDDLEQLARFAVGLAPAGLHIPYLDASRVSLKEHRGPSSIIGVDLCAGIAAVEVLNILLKRQAPWCVPGYAQFDAYRRRYCKGRLPGGNRHPIQRMKLWHITRLLRRNAGP